MILIYNIDYLKGVVKLIKKSEAIKFFSIGRNLGFELQKVNAPGKMFKGIMKFWENLRNRL